MHAFSFYLLKVNLKLVSFDIFSDMIHEQVQLRPATGTNSCSDLKKRWGNVECNVIMMLSDNKMKWYNPIAQFEGVSWFEWNEKWFVNKWSKKIYMDKARRIRKNDKVA